MFAPVSIYTPVFNSMLTFYGGFDFCLYFECSAGVGFDVGFGFYVDSGCCLILIPMSVSISIPLDVGIDRDFAF